jgi:UDP-glucose 4-epimerase
MIVVTGIAGFIGSHVAALFEPDVVGVDDFRAGVNFAPKTIPVWAVDVASLTSQDLRDATAIVHCAARADVQYNWDNVSERERMWRENIETTTSLLEATPRDVSVILLSTCAVYGDTGDGREEQACVATSPYAASKLACEALVQAYATYRKSPWYVFRLGCVVGPHYHHGHIAEFVERHKRDGRLVARSSGPAKSFVHVADVADAIGLAVTGAAPSGVYNLNGGLWSARETVRVMGVLESTTWPEGEHGWPGDTVPIVGSEKYRKASGWRPTRTVEAGVKEALGGLGWNR